MTGVGVNEATVANNRTRLSDMHAHANPKNGAIKRALCSSKELE